MQRDCARPICSRGTPHDPPAARRPPPAVPACGSVCAKLKVSHPIAHLNPRWKTFTKFRVHEMQAKIPLTKLVSGERSGYRALPSIVKASATTTPFLAMNLGDKVVTLVDYAGNFREEGFFIPLDYGTIVGMEWLPNDLLVIGLTNGYIISVNVPLFLSQRNPAAKRGGTPPRKAAPANRRPKAMSTTRVRAVDTRRERQGGGTRKGGKRGRRGNPNGRARTRPPRR